MKAEIGIIARNASRSPGLWICPAPSLRVPVTSGNRELLRRMRALELSAWEAGHVCRSPELHGEAPIQTHCV